MTDGERGAATLYDAVGGMPFFERLVDAFYTGVAGDDILLPLYPEAPDLRGAPPLPAYVGEWAGP